MGITVEALEFARDLFSEVGEITHRKMMGGATLYCDGDIFAILDGTGRIFLRTKGALAGTLRTAGGSDFAWERSSDGKVLTMGYVSLPDTALDDPEQACEWAREALREGKA